MIDDAQAIQTVIDLMAIPGKSGHEAAIAGDIMRRLRDAGLSQGAIETDTAHQRSPHGGEQGNLIVRLPGTVRGPRRLLMAHIDTVPLCVGCEPVRRGGEIISRNPATALGGDNRAGASVVLLALLAILRHKLPHPPLTFFWPVQEEVGLVGARHVTLSKLGKPALCFNWDGGAPNIAVTGATGADHLDIRVTGLASHAGAYPRAGISAAVIAGKAIADLEANGWHGRVEQGKQLGTSNIGARIVNAYLKAFRSAAKSTRNEAGRSGSVEIEVHHKYESFRLPDSEQCVVTALQAIEAEGQKPLTRIVDGGLDANWLTRHGLPTVTLGCGQAGIHTVSESLHIASYLTACRIALRLATHTSP
jgi:tripeptide aminopeptidase